VWWWVTYLFDWFFARLALRVPGENATLEDLREHSVRWLASDAFTILPLTLAILVVRSHTRRLDARGAAPEPAGSRASVPLPWTPPPTT
jgi:hypothetical protein